MIVKSLDQEWLAEVKSETMGLNHLVLSKIYSPTSATSAEASTIWMSRNSSRTFKSHGMALKPPRQRKRRQIRRELLKVGQSKNPELRLAFALATFQASGEFEPALRDWEAKPKADQTFGTFRVFIQKEFGKQHKQNKTTAKSVGYGIANSITDKEVEQIEHLEAQALFVAELANSMQEQSQKQFKEMMEVFKATFEKPPSPTNPRNPKSGADKKKKKCPHLGWRCITTRGMFRT